MIDLAALAAVATVAAAICAASAQDGRAVAIAMAVAMIAAPLAASPAPGSLALAARVAGALLAADLVWVATRLRGVTSDGSPIGLSAEVAVGAAAFLIGLWIGPVKPLPGPISAQAAGVAVTALAVLPLVSREPLRIGLGAAMLCLGISLLDRAWLGPGPAMEDLVVAVLLVGILGTTGLLIAPRLQREAPAEPLGVAMPGYGDVAPLPAAPLSGAPLPAAPSLFPEDKEPETRRLADMPPRRYAGHMAVRRTRHPRDPGPQA